MCCGIKILFLYCLTFLYALTADYRAMSFIHWEHLVNKKLAPVDFILVSLFNESVARHKSLGLIKANCIELQLAEYVI